MLESLITARTKGVIVVHMGGYPCEIEIIRDLCKRRGLFLIEDCAHALGTTIKDTHAGNIGTTGCFSFYPTKQITTGEGGMVICNAEDVAHFARTHRAFGIDTPPAKRGTPGIYDVQGLGYNYRMTDFQAALGVTQLQRYVENLRCRQENAKRYLATIESMDLPVTAIPFSHNNSYFLFQLLVDRPDSRNNLIRHLVEAGVGVSIHYATPVPCLSYYRQKYELEPSLFPGAISYAGRNLSLPVYPSLKEDDIDRVCEALSGFLR